MSRRSRALVAFLAALAISTPALAISTPALAKDTVTKQSVGRDPAAPISAQRNYSSEEAAALGATARRLAEERERERDRRLNKIGGSICNGC